MNTAFLLIAALVAGGVAAFVLGRGVCAAAERYGRSLTVRARMQGVQTAKAHAEDAYGLAAGAWRERGRAVASLVVGDLARRGVPAFGRVSCWLLARDMPARWLGMLAGTCAIGFERERGLAATVCDVSPRTVCDCLLLAMLVACALGVLLTGSPVVGALFASAVPVAAHLLASRAIERQRDEAYVLLPDVFAALGACFGAGHSLSQAIEQVADEFDGPLGAQFGQAADALKAGRSVPEVLDDLAGSSPFAEMRFIGVALDVQSRTGGSLAGILEGASRSVSTSVELKRSLAVQTAQARLSARVVTVMPLALLIIIALADPHYLVSFFTSAAGWAIFLLALALEATGIFWIRRILSVELG